MATYLFKTEPGEFSLADLQAKPDAVWDGVSNASALIHLRTIRKGDEVLIYHTGDEKAIVGLARATSDAFEDPKQPGTNDRGQPKHAVVKLRTVAKAKTPVTLAQIKADALFKDFALVKQGRLSVMPVEAKLDKALRKLAGL